MPPSPTTTGPTLGSVVVKASALRSVGVGFDPRRSLSRDLKKMVNPVAYRLALSIKGSAQGVEWPISL